MDGQEHVDRLVITTTTTLNDDEDYVRMSESGELRSLDLELNRLGDGNG